MRFRLKTFILKLKGYRFAIPKYPCETTVTLHTLGCQHLKDKRRPSRARYFKTLLECQVAAGKRNLIPCQMCYPDYWREHRQEYAK